MTRIATILFAITMLSLIGNSCGSPPIEHNLLKCNVDEYPFTLGDTITSILRDYPGLEESNYQYDYSDSASLYTQTYEEHMFGFSFYDGKLIEASFTIPQSELEDGSIIVDGNAIPFDTQFKKNMEVSKSHYTVVSEPHDFDGMKSITVTVRYTDANAYLKRAE